MTDIYLIRHGDAVASQSDDGPLSSLGIAQAERLRDRLTATHEIRADILLASPLLRARQTAEIIAPALHVPVILRDDLQEFHIGTRKGLTDEKIVAHYGLIDFAQEPERPVLPDGESWSQFVQKVSCAFDSIVRAYAGKTVVVVCHDGVIGASFRYFLGVEIKFIKGIFRPAFAQFYTNCTSITYWHHSTFHDIPMLQAAQWMLVKYNDDVHLYDLVSPGRLNWQGVTVQFEGGPGVRPVRVRSERE